MNKFESLDFSTLNHDPLAEQLAQVIAQKTQNTDDILFYRIMVAYYFTKIASMMHCSIETHDQGPVPVNMYSILLAPSGFGKNRGVNILEDQVLDQFRTYYLNHTFPLQAADHLPKLANKRAIRKSQDPDDELDRVTKEFEGLGPLAFSFDSATVPAIKQMRHKILMANAGSVCLEVDELGSNLTGSMEALGAFLELYDVGKIKQKLTKNTSDSMRSEDIEGRTPTNLLMFGEPTKLFNGGKLEEEFYTLMDTGYARRCFFTYVKTTRKKHRPTAHELYDQMVNVDSDTFIEDLSEKLMGLADPINFGRKLQVSKDVMITLLEYKIHCETLADDLPNHSELQRKELSHRFGKAFKLAGTYAFINGSLTIEEEHLLSAIKVTEESGESFKGILNRDRNYAKLAKYLADVQSDVTHADLVEVLPFYPKTNSQQRDLLALATGYGYKNNIIIQKTYIDGIEFMIGESLKETNLDEMIISYSRDLARDYLGEKVPFDKLDKLTSASGYHWASHHFLDRHRCEDKAIEGFNLVVIDVDGGTSLDTAKMLLKEYKALYYTTKRHTPQNNRFRIVLPMNYTLKLDGKDFKEFMTNIYEWLPFSVDDATNQRSRKWESFNGHSEYVDGQLFDVLDFIPKTSKNENRKQQILDTASLTNLERWFVQHTGVGNRSNQFIKYALLLVDSGHDTDQVRQCLLDLNSKLKDKMTVNELDSTIMITVAKAVIKRDAAA